MTATRRLAMGLAAALLLVLGTAAAGRAADNEAVAAALEQLFEKEQSAAGSVVPDAYAEPFLRFYQSRAFKPIWTRDSGPKGKAKALLEELTISGANGLTPDFYNVDAIGALMQSSDPADLAKLDALLSGALIAFGNDLRNGHIGPDVPGSENAVEPVPLDPTELVTGAEAAADLRTYMGTLLIADFRYVRLLGKLSEFSRIAATGQWPAIDGDGAAIRAGKSDPRIKDIRRLLALSGDLPLSEMGGGAVLDEQVAAAISSYQQSHGLPITGAIDAVTLKDMSVPIEARIDQIKLNLERRRWQNHDLGADYVYINLADDSVKIVREDESLPEQDVTDATALKGLPTFFGEITGVAARPDEGVSLTVRSAFVDELGSRTGERSIPISNPTALAINLLEDQADGVTVDELLAAKTARSVEFARPVPLFVTYVTVWANGDGSVHFRPDKFGRDAKLAELLKLD